jgi:hypothetical protein
MAEQQVCTLTTQLEQREDTYKTINYAPPTYETWGRRSELQQTAATLRSTHLRMASQAETCSVKQKKVP